jgi:hypothetical protein
MRMLEPNIGRFPIVNRSSIFGTWTRHRLEDD